VLLCLKNARRETPPRRWRNSAAVLRSGEEPVEVAQWVMRAIKEEELHTFTHPEYRTLLE
jgi:hypothetical protein